MVNYTKPYAHDDGNMKNQLAVGLMSGTSADGISAAVASFRDKEYELIGYQTTDFPEPLQSQIRSGGQLNTAELSQLNVQLGILFAKAVNKLLKKHHLNPKKIVCIGSHGQTIYHGPQDKIPNTLQMADPAVIAEQTGITVVSDFRKRDMATGGEGAPLIPYFDQYFFGSGPARAFLNIGGISNVAIVGKKIKNPMAFDMGPGNILMDMAVRIITDGKESFDHLGQGAKQGEIDTHIVDQMIKHPFFSKSPPKSTGPELFNKAFLLEHLGNLLKSNPNNALATLNYFTCLAIQEGFRNFVFNKVPVEEIVVSGGGAKNKTLMHKLECLFAPIPVTSIEKMGIPVQAKEPLAFAFFGLRAMNHKINHLPQTTGAKHARVLGSITYA